jgi:hypothetical protein
VLLWSDLYTAAADAEADADDRSSEASGEDRDDPDSSDASGRPEPLSDAEGSDGSTSGTESVRVSQRRDLSVEIGLSQKRDRD